MTTEKLIEMFRVKLVKDKKNIGWFIKNKCNDVSYNYFVMQINEFAKMQESVKQSILDYLGERDER